MSLYLAFILKCEITVKSALQGGGFLILSLGTEIASCFDKSFRESSKCFVGDGCPV